MKTANIVEFLNERREMPKNTVGSVLNRPFHSGSEIMRISRGMWGLQESYPNQRFARRGVED